MFNSQPEGMEYALAGHTICTYAQKVRKGMSIHLRYLDTDILWNTLINEPKIPSTIAFEEIKRGRDLFTFVNQENRVPIVITDDVYFYPSSLVDLMLGEIIYVEEQMPDFF